MSPLRVMLVVAFFVAAGATLGVSAVVASDSERDTMTEEVEARRIVAQFFRSLNERRYAQTCELLADGYFARHAGSARPLCAIGLRAGFLWSQDIRWRISGVSTRGMLLVVGTVADGAPGWLLLVRSKGRLRILDVIENPTRLRGRP